MGKHAPIWVYLTKKLPKEMWKSLPEGDIRGCYKNMINFNSDDANSQVVELTSKALKFAKGSRPMTSWLDEYYDIMDQLETLRAPLSMNSVRAVILDSLKGDQRYTDALRDLKRNPSWQLPRIYASVLSPQPALAATS